MTEPLNGLRFDIYERVHLPENVADIAELEEVELVPHMQAIPREDHVLLKGHLLLTGSYRSLDQRAEANRLEHWIPVEISLPPSRVERLEDLAVEIDNFDVDLLSSRSLNVTGVLGLRGLQLSAPQAPVWRENEFTVVHQAPQADPFDLRGADGEDAAYGSSPAAGAPYPESEAPKRYAAPDSPESSYGQRQDAESSAHSPEPNASSALYRPPEEPNPAGRLQLQRENGSEHSSPTEWTELSDQVTWTESLAKAAQSPAYSSGQTASSHLSAQTAPASAPDPQPLPDRPEPQLQPPQESPAITPLNAGDEDESWGDIAIERLNEKQEPAAAPIVSPLEQAELKVGFGSKRAADPPAPPAPEFGVGLLSQLGDKGFKREAEARAAEAEARNAKEEEPSSLSGETTGDEIEWARLFIASESAEQSFRKVKLCIVQREDTLEAIATRYNVQSRELQLYNRLSDPYVSEGQVIYIP